MRFLFAVFLSCLASSAWADRFAVIDADGDVVNTVELEPGANWSPPKGTTLKPLPPSISRGDTWDGTTFIRKQRDPELQARRDRREAAVKAAEEAEKARMDALATENANLKARIEALESKAAISR